MLSATFTPAWAPRLRFPLLVSPKLDGFRALVLEDGKIYSKNLKLIRNEFIQNWFSAVLPPELLQGLDGELIVGPPTGGSVINRTSSGVTARAGEPDFTYWVFDNWMAEDDTFVNRLRFAGAQAKSPAAARRVKQVPHRWVKTMEELLAAEQEFLDAGYEGIMLRDPDGRYKHGRSTEREGLLWKFKRFTDFEFVITGLEEAEVNLNDATIDELGRTKRSSAKAGKVPKDMIGTLLGRRLDTGAEVRVGPGNMTHAQRVYYWKHSEELIDQIGVAKVFEYGAVNADRFPTFKCIRDKDDL